MGWFNMESRRRVFMGAAIGPCADFTADELRKLAKASRDARQTRRLLALASINEDGRRSEAARIGGIGLQIIRDWVVRFNAEGPAGLLDRKAPGRRRCCRTRSVRRWRGRWRRGRSRIWAA